MTPDYTLHLTTPAALAAGRVDGPALAGAGRLINSGLLGGEALGLDVAPAIELLHEVADAASLRQEHDPDAHRLLSDEDLPLLRDTYAQVAAGLSAALDRDGRPMDAAGERLIGHPHVHLDEHGRAVIGRRGPLAVQVAEDLPALVALLDRAAREHLYAVLT